MSRDTSFYYSFLVLPPRKRSAIVAVWDFCRAVDDAVDEVVPEAEWAGGLTPEARTRAAVQLASWRDELDAAYTGTPRTSQGNALQPFIREFNLPRGAFEELIDGVEMDLAHARYRHVRRAARVLPARRVDGRADLRRDLRLPRPRQPRLRRESRHGAAADQHRSRRRRRSAPRPHLPAGRGSARGSASPRTICGAGSVTAAGCGAAAVRMRTRARPTTGARPAAAGGRRRSLVAAEIMGGIYFEILQRIERAGYDVFSRRIRVPRPQRALIALRIWLQTLIGMRRRAPVPKPTDSSVKH